jgi:DNA-directed RNA polymerase subunit alpha
MDSLEMEIWTDGRIAPKDALEASAAILRDHLQIFVGGQVAEKDVISMMKEDELRLYKVLAQDVEVLDLSVRAMNCLNSADIRIVGELCSKSEARMLKYRNFGKKSLDEIKEKIEKIGLGLGMTFSENIMIALDKESEKLRLNNEENK